MSFYKVNRAFLSGKGNKVFKGNDVIKESQVENFSELIANGSIIPCKENGDFLDDEIVEVKTDTSVKIISIANNTTQEPTIEPTKTEEKKVEELTVEPMKTETKELTPVYSYEKDGKVIDVFTEKESSVSSMRIELIRRGIDFDGVNSKKDLFALLLKS